MDDGVFTLASLNLHWGLDRHNVPFDAVAAVARLDADVVALQETWRPNGEAGLARDIADALGYQVLELAMGAGGPHDGKGLDVLRDPASATGTWGTALLSRVPLRGLPAVDLGVVPLDRAARRALAADVDVAAGPPTRTVRVVCAHLSHRLWGSVPQLRRLRTALDARSPAGPPVPTVVAGDMNMWGPIVSGMIPGLRRAFTGRTWPAHRPHSQIDHILVSPDVEVLEAGVLPACGSDHRPVKARLRVAAGTFAW